MAEKKPPKKLLILGTATNRAEAPFDDPSWTIWGTGGLANAVDVKRLDACFELHPERHWKEPAVLEILKKFPATLYMIDECDEIPNSKRYPIEEVKKTFYIPTMGKSLYVTNTVSYMFMLAYLEGFTEIETYGVYMEHETEYVHQRLNCEYYIGWLTAKGVKVTLHGGDVLKASFAYGFEEPPMFAKLIEDGRGLENGKAELEKEIESAKQKLWMQKGGIKYNQDLRKQFGGY
jgi:hypothetical protein